jgi:peptidoglycan/xylan/chitin deacetylase (PgdA/CDA1 family)
MKTRHGFILLLVLSIISCISFGQSPSQFTWPEGKQVAISLTFDDGRASQVEGGTKVLDEYGVKATFYVLPSAVEKNLEEWKKTVDNGHEIGNHSLHHPCSGNFPWARNKALENYSIDQMRSELIEANKQIQNLLGVECKVFAYPCGQTFVGRGSDTRSYVPVIADLFSTGRGWMDEGPNDPAFCDLAQLTGVESDGKDFEQILPIIESAKKNGQWLVLAGHEISEAGPQTTRLSMLKKLLEYAQNPSNGIWLAPVGTVAKYVEAHQKK